MHFRILDKSELTIMSMQYHYAFRISFPSYGIIAVHCHDVSTTYMTCKIYNWLKSLYVNLPPSWLSCYNWFMFTPFFLCAVKDWDSPTKHPTSCWMPQGLQGRGYQHRPPTSCWLYQGLQDWGYHHGQPLALLDFIHHYVFAF